MDPDEALRMFRNCVREAHAAEANEDPATAKVLYENAIEHAIALDEFLSRGGLLPEAWQST